MSDDKEQVGLGEVIYSVEEERSKSPAAKKAERQAREDVEEADRESFPASDAPGFSGATTREETKEGE